MYYFHKDPECLESRSGTEAQIPADGMARDTV